MSREGDHDNPQNKCVICDEDGPELYCMVCDPVGLPYHQKCWNSQLLHRRNQSHRAIPIRDVERLRYINEPNKWTSIEDKMIEHDTGNCFIRFDMNNEKLQFGPRAHPLLRQAPQSHSSFHWQCPSFVSFIGRTMNGKSFLLRALQGGGTVDFPSPIPAPGLKNHNHNSTSNDIHLYADSVTASSESPILFLDCEGFEGSEKPLSMAAAVLKKTRRRECVEIAYPRLVYAFSTCIVFVTSGPLAESAAIGKRLRSYASKGARGSQNQGFKPSLFVVFNRFADGNIPDFDWSIETSTKAFLAHEGLGNLQLFYDRIRVIYIPNASGDKSDIALKQITAFQERLRQDYEIAFRRRQEFRLVFPPTKLISFLWRALELFSKSHDSVFDWSIEAARVWYGSGDLVATLHDLWKQCALHYEPQTISPRDLYRLTRKIFEIHVEFCCRLCLSREPPPGMHVRTIPDTLNIPIDTIDQLLLEHSVCGASSSSGVECREIRDRHGSQHQGFESNGHSVYRWPGTYEEPKDGQFQPFRKSFEAAVKKKGMTEVSLRTLHEQISLPEDIRSTVSCFGCLKGAPSTILSCGHAFCLACIRDLTDDPEEPHRLEEIPCPFHKSHQLFSPRLLPILSGCRILSLDGGGVKGLAQLVILRHIEEKCFNIPTTQLYDLIVGTSIGGQIALALSAATPSTPLTVDAAIKQFKELMMNGFVRKLHLLPSKFPWTLGKTNYKATPLENQLQGFFGMEAKLLGKPASLNVAVTTVLQDDFKGHLVTNYNRNAPVDAYPLLLEPDLEKCMPIWAAARCTSAALPYFKAFQWRGQMLLDGGFQLNCPAAAAFSEAKYIWPQKSCDILLSLGTGTGTSTTRNKLPAHQFIQLMNNIANAIADTEITWATFSAGAQPGLVIPRLNPVYSGKGFNLDDIEKLDEIEDQTKTWILKCHTEVNLICDHLIAALFFFRPTEHTGEICCRLPASLPSRQKLIEGMLEEDDLCLFVVDVGGGKPYRHIDVTESLFGCTGVINELRIPVNLPDLATTGEITVHIKMRNLKHIGSSTKRWTSISGSPYLLREDGSWSSGTSSRMR